jgi:hypothetical protein
MGSHAILLAAVLFGTLTAAAQLPMPDRPGAGARETYWVDSTAHPSSTYTWAIDGTVVQNGTMCVFVTTWQTEGMYTLTVREVTATGCEGEIRSGRVIVSPPAGDPDPVISIFPNPVYGPDIKFQLAMKVGSMVTIDLFAANGQLISRILEGYLSGGDRKTIVYGHQLPQGIYLFRIRTDTHIYNERIIVIREY